MEVIEFLDNAGNTMVQRIPEDGPTEIKWGAQLTVRESQVAVFFRDGKALDIFEAGRHVLQTQNIPILTKLVTSLGYGSTSPFRAEVYFINKKLFPNQKWGTKEPILFKDTELKMIRIRSFGIFSIQITDPSLFLNKVVGTQGYYTDAHITDYLKNILITRFTTVLGNELKTVFDMPQGFDNLSLVTKNALRLDFEGLGLLLHDLFINSINVPPEVQSMIDTRSGMSALGNMDEFMKYKIALSMEKSAENPGGISSAGMGMGTGLGMGFMMPQIIQQSMNPSSQQGNEKDSAMDKLKKLKELLDLGVITQEEFNQKKSKLMDQI